MGNKARIVIVAVVAAVALAAVAVAAWPLWRGWLPHPAWIRAWIDYLVLDVKLDRWGPLLLLALVGIAELIIGLTLYRRSGEFERYMKRVGRQHSREAETLEQQISLLKEEQQALRAELELRDELIHEGKVRLWQRFEELRQECRLPQGPLVSPTVPALDPEARGELRQTLSQLERIELVSFASARWARNEQQAQLRADELVRLGNACYALGQSERALSHYVRALSLAPTNSTTLINRAIVNCSLGQHANALQDLERALKLGEDPHVYLYRGLCREHVGEDRRALDDYGRAVRLDPGFAEAYYRRGLLYARQGEQTKALQDQYRALELDPDHVGALTARGAVYASLGDFQGAMSDLDRACIVAPTYYEAFYQRGLARHQLKMTDEALQDLTRVIELAPAFGPAHAARADVYLAMDEPAQAMADYDRAIELQPKSAASYNARGMARIAGRDYRGAITDLDRALELDPAMALALANRGSAYEKVGDYEQAIRDLNRALVLSPDLAVAYYSRGMAYGSKGEYDRASRDLNKAVELDPSLGKQQKAGAGAA